MAITNPEVHEPYYKALDGVRAMAFISIMVFHVFELWQDTPMPALLIIPDVMARAMWVGVDLFFVMSGFLITGILLRARGKPYGLRTFYLRRTLRIFPPYYLILVILFGFLLIQSGTIDALLQPKRISYWLYLQNFFIAMQSWDDFRPLAHLWSLAVEEQFYLIWPLIALLIPFKHMRWVIICMLVIPPLLRTAMLLAGSYYVAVYVLIFARLDALAAGALLAVVALTAEGREKLAKASLHMLVSGMLLIGTLHLYRDGYELDDPVVQTIGYSANLLASAGLIALLCFRSKTYGLRAFFSTAPMSWMGRRSYTGYLLHWPVALLVHHILVLKHVDPMPGIIVNLFAMAVVTLIAAELSWRFYERRWLQLRGSYDPGKRII